MSGYGYPHNPQGPAYVYGAPPPPSDHTPTAQPYGAPPPSSHSLFGAPPPSSVSLYGAPPPSSVSLFGGPPPSSVSLYGDPPPSSASLFGAPSHPGPWSGYAGSGSGYPSAPPSHHGSGRDIRRRRRHTTGRVRGTHPGRGMGARPK